MIMLELNRKQAKSVLLDTKSSVIVCLTLFKLNRNNFYHHTVHHVSQPSWNRVKMCPPQDFIRRTLDDAIQARSLSARKLLSPYLKHAAWIWI